MHISLLLCSAGNKILGINDMIEIQSSSFTDRIPNTALLRLRDIQKTKVRDIQKKSIFTFNVHATNVPGKIDM
jgi:hypothetical protein